MQRDLFKLYKIASVYDFLWFWFPMMSRIDKWVQYLFLPRSLENHHTWQNAWRCFNGCGKSVLQPLDFVTNSFVRCLLGYFMLCILDYFIIKDWFTNINKHCVYGGFTTLIFNTLSVEQMVAYYTLILVHNIMKTGKPAYIKVWWNNQKSANQFLLENLFIYILK